MRLTGKFFKAHLKKRISIIGKILEGSGSAYKLESACGMTVNVIFTNRPENSLVNQVVEIMGVVQSADSLVADEILEFPLEFTQDFDKEVHAKAIELEQEYGGQYWKDVAFAETESICN